MAKLQIQFLILGLLLTKSRFRCWSHAIISEILFCQHLDHGVLSLDYMTNDLMLMHIVTLHENIKIKCSTDNYYIKELKNVTLYYTKLLKLIYVLLLTSIFLLQ